MAILCYLQVKEGPNIGYRKIMYQHWKGLGLFELEEQHLACQVRNILKTGKLSKVGIEGQKRQMRRLHVDSVRSQTGEPDTAEEEAVTQSNDNVLLQEFAVIPSDYVEDTGAIESEGDITKQLKLLLKSSQNDPIPSLRSADVFQSNFQYYLK